MLAIHEEQLAEHGGGVGIRDIGLLQSALARPRNLAAYGGPEDVDAAAIAASYAFGVIKNYPFVDGNKRTGFVLLELFLQLNGLYLIAGDDECVSIMLEVAPGVVGEQELAGWIRSHSGVDS